MEDKQKENKEIIEQRTCKNQLCDKLFKLNGWIFVAFIALIAFRNYPIDGGIILWPIINMFGTLAVDYIALAKCSLQADVTKNDNFDRISWILILVGLSTFVMSLYFIRLF